MGNDNSHPFHGDKKKYLANRAKLIEIQEQQEAGVDPSDIKKKQAFISQDKRTKALGCVAGALIGDCVGTSCLGVKQVSKEQAALALSCPDSAGPYHFVKGQVSYMGELNMALLNAISEMETGKFDTMKIAKWYSTYMLSNPQRVGQPKNEALIELAKHPGEKDFIEKISMAVAKHNAFLVNSAGLCRAAPLAVVCSAL